MSLPGPMQSQKEDAWEELMAHVEEFADIYGYAPLTVVKILVADYEDKMKETINEKN